jgi:hypothetical protein
MERAPWGDTVLKKHLARLEDLEYLLVHHGGRGQSFVYELLFDGQGMDGKPWLPGLIDLDSLDYDEKKSPPSRPQIAGMSRGGRPHETRVNTGVNGIFAQKRENSTDTGNEENHAVTVAIGDRR